MQVCRVMGDGEILNPHLDNLPLNEAIIYGDRVLSQKLSKRLSCAIKHLPIRLKFSYNYSIEDAISIGISKDPTMVLNSQIFIEGLISAEEITEKFERFLKMKEIDFDSYLRDFDYDERKKMKIQIAELLELLEKDMVELIDIRFKEEYEAWHLGIARNIPLNELPDRLDEIDSSKTVVTICPHYDRAEIARLYLKLKGYEARYLTDGMLGLVDYLRGDRARDTLNRLRSKR